MVDRELTKREREIYEMIPDADNMTFWNIVDDVRKATDTSRYKLRKELKHLHNQ